MAVLSLWMKMKIWVLHSVSFCVYILTVSVGRSLVGWTRSRSGFRCCNLIQSKSILMSHQTLLWLPASPTTLSTKLCWNLLIYHLVGVSWPEPISVDCAHLLCSLAVWVGGWSYCRFRVQQCPKNHGARQHQWEMDFVDPRCITSAVKINRLQRCNHTYPCLM
jgi:hypothetical protein